MSSKLNFIIYPDLMDWERSVMDSTLASLAAKHSVERVTSLKRGQLSRFKEGERVWIVCRSWQKALRYLGTPIVRTYVSVLAHPSATPSLPFLFWSRKFAPPASVTLLAHSPLSHRHSYEISGISERQLRHIPLPMFQASTVERRGEPASSVTKRPVVGTFGNLDGGSNLHFFLSVAHYIVQHCPDALVRFIGSGPLEKHFDQMVVDLGIGQWVQRIPAQDLNQISSLDVFLYSPLHNTHFAPLLAASQFRIPVVCTEVGGIEEYVQDSHNGFVLPVHETKPTGELIIRLLNDSELRTSMGNAFFETSREHFSTDALFSVYESLFFSRGSTTGAVRAA